MMKIFKIILGFCFLSVLVSLPVQSDTAGDLTNENNIDHYGIVDGIYPEESRIVVNDLNLHYFLSSTFYDQSGTPISDIRRSLKIGTPVVFRYYQRSSKFILQGLHIISKAELNDSTKR